MHGDGPAIPSSVGGGRRACVRKRLWAIHTSEAAGAGGAKGVAAGAGRAGPGCPWTGVPICEVHSTVVFEVEVLLSNEPGGREAGCRWYGKRGERRALACYGHAIVGVGHPRRWPSSRAGLLCTGSTVPSPTTVPLFFLTQPDATHPPPSPPGCCRAPPPAAPPPAAAAPPCRAARMSCGSR